MLYPLPAEHPQQSAPLAAYTRRVLASPDDEAAYCESLDSIADDLLAATGGGAAG